MLSKIKKTVERGPFFPQLTIPGAFPHSPTISPEETRLVAELLEKDAKEHHMYFNDKGFHNHLTHMLLADYSLGASVKRLKEVYKQEDQMQRPKPQKHSDFKWTEHLGEKEYYSDYLDFMLKEVEKLGRIGAIEKYAFDEENNMLARFVGGVYHPMIHIGYGLEFGIDGMVAEGLAQMCTHADLNKALVPREIKTSKGVGLTALDIAKAMIEDKHFDGIVKYEDDRKFMTFYDKKPELILEYAEKWSLSPDKEDLLDKVRELMILGVAVYAGPQRPDKEVVFDFFLMHALTSSLFLPVFVQHLSPKLGMKFLRGKFAMDLAHFAGRNRPKLHLEQFTSTTEFTKSWKEIFELAMAHGDEHIPKVIRALKQAERWDPDETLGKGAYRAIASMTVENVITFAEKEKDDKRCWTHDAVGFDEFWFQIPERKQPSVAHLS